MGWVLLLTGAAVAVTGMTLAVGTMTVSRVELYRLIAHRLRRAGPAGAVLAIPGRLLGAAGGITAVGVLLSACGLMALVARLPLWVGGATVVLGAVPLFVSVVYAVPRALGARWAQPIVESAVPWLERFSALFAPLVLVGTDARRRAALAAFLQSDEESLDAAELITVLMGVLSFTERPLREIVTPRTDMVAIREGTPLDEVARIFAESGYSRLPVYRESLDNIVGMTYALDLLKVAPGAELPLRPVTVAPASKRCADLLFEMQRDRRQFAIVLDEYGGTAGIATFQDLLAELVAEIFPGPESRGNGKAAALEVAEVTGATPCSAIEARFGTAMAADAETVGGLLARAAGRIPQAGERFVIAELEFDVLAATPTRVERVVVRRGPVSPVRLRGSR